VFHAAGIVAARNASKPGGRCTTIIAAAGFVCLRHTSLGRRIALRRSHRIHPSSGYAGDQTRAALKGHVTPRPAQGDRQAVAKADEEVDVGDATRCLQGRACTHDGRSLVLWSAMCSRFPLQRPNSLMTLGDASNILRKSGSTAHHNDRNLCRVPLLQQEKQVDWRICPMTVVWALDLSRWRCCRTSRHPLRLELYGRSSFLVSGCSPSGQRRASVCRQHLGVETTGFSRLL
jgi:hypothetical protein